MFQRTGWEQMVRKAFDAGETGIRIPPGRYHVPAGESAHFVLENLRRPENAPFTLDMTGVELVCQDNQTKAVLIKNCKSLTITGAEVGYAVPTMSQGEVTAILDEGKTVEVTLDEGYPSLEQSIEKTAYVYDRITRRMKNDTPDMYAKGAKHIAGRVWRLFYDQDMRASNVAAGDVLGLRCEGAMAVVVENCESIILRCMTITDGCFAILETGGEGGNLYDRITVAAREKPAGAVHPRVLSTYADAFHSASVRKGPTLRGCRFEAMGDDCVNIHGAYAYYAGRDEEGASMYACAGADVFDRAGDRVRLLDIMGNILHETRIQKVLGEVAGFSMPDGAFAHSNKRFRPKAYFKAVLEEPFDPPIGTRMSNLDKGGSGFRLIDNYFGPNRARGALIKADDGVVEGNLFSGQSIHTLLISPEYYWNESCFVNNLLIRNNIFENGGFVTNYRPAIAIEGEFGGKGGISHRNITIEQNIFRENNMESILIQHAKSVTVKENIFGARNASAQKTRACAGHIRVQNARDVLLIHNTHSQDMPLVFDNGNAGFVEE